MSSEKDLAPDCDGEMGGQALFEKVRGLGKECKSIPPDTSVLKPLDF